MKKLTKYLPDVLILLGVWIFSYVLLFPIKEDLFEGVLIGNDYSNHFKLIGIILISIGLDIAISRFARRK